MDVVSLQHLSLNDAKLAIGEITGVLKPRGEFFSYRLSNHSLQFTDLSQAKVDVATLLNIDDVTMPLANNGPIAFWSPSLAGMVYEEVGMKLLTCERVGRTYSNGQYVEYLPLISKNDS